MTLAEAKNLSHGQILYSSEGNNADGTPARWRVNGNVKTWKRESNAHRVEVPIKWGLYGYGYLTEDCLGYLHLTEEVAIATRA